MKYIFVHINYNNSLLSIECIESILKQSFYSENVFVYLIDNNSSDEEKRILNQWKLSNEHTPVEFVYLKENIGYFPALNVGLSLVKNKTIEHIFIIGNNDLLFNPHFLKVLGKIKYPDNVFVISPNIITDDGKFQNPVSINKLSFHRKLFLKIYFTSYYIGVPLYFIIQKIRSVTNKSSRIGSNTEQYIYLGYGACYVLLPNFFKYYDKLDDSVFLYGEEALIANQVYSANGKILYVPQLIVNHKEHATSNKIKSKIIYNISRRTYNQYKNYL